MKTNTETQRCRICGSTKTSILRTHVRFNIKRNVLRCKVCNFVYLENPKINKAFYTSKKYRSRYSPNLQKSLSSREIFETYLPFQHEIIASMGSLIKPDRKILDVGCSTGHFLHALKGKVRTRVGIELSKDAVGFIKKNLDFPVYNESIETVKIKEGPFDVITALQVLEHVENPEIFITALGKHLKPGGYLYLELPNIDDVLLETYNVSGYKEFYYREPHLSYFSAPTLQRLLKKAGFVGKIKTVQRYNLINHINWILTDHPQTKFQMGNGTPVLAHDDKKRGSKEINAFIKRVDVQYKDLVGRLGLGESLVFVGKKQNGK